MVHMSRIMLVVATAVNLHPIFVVILIIALAPRLIVILIVVILLIFTIFAMTGVGFPRMSVRTSHGRVMNQ